MIVTFIGLERFYLKNYAKFQQNIYTENVAENLSYFSSLYVPLEFCLYLELKVNF